MSEQILLQGKFLGIEEFLLSPAGEGEDKPTRFSETLVDKFVDQMPAKLWPRMQHYFFAVGAAVLALDLIGVAALVWQRLNGAVVTPRL